MNEDERRRLEEIEERLSREEPRLARRLSDPAQTAIRWRRPCRWLLDVSVLVLVVGITLEIPLLCLLGWCGVVGTGSILYLTHGAGRAATR